MSYAMRKETARSEYMNRAGRRMYRYFGDLGYDAKTIEELQPNEKVYFIVCPSNTHSASPLNLESRRKEIKQIYGNHIVIEVRRDDKNGYYVENYDRDLSRSWDDVPQHVIDAFNDFVLECEQD